MNSELKIKSNVKQVVPFFDVVDMGQSLHFYIDGLGFEMKNKWMGDDKLLWCWLQLGGAALMLQEGKKQEHGSRVPEVKPGIGVSIYFMCEDALAIYRELRSRNIQAKKPFVGNGMWVTELSDPDGYKLFFESPTDEAEETVLQE